MNTQVIRRAVALLLVVSGVLFFIVRGYHDEREALRLRDFKQPYASARCLLQACNPYSDVDTLRVYEQAQGPNDDYKVIEPYSALYPPFSFALLTPIGAMKFPLAARVWMALVAGLFSVAALLMIELCLPLAPLAVSPLLMVFTATSTILLMLGQVSGPVIGLLGIGMWCLLRQTALPVAVVCFALAALLKPHDAVFVLLYLLFATRSWRRVFLWTATLAVTLGVAGTVWCAVQPASRHWLQDWRANLAGNSTPAGVNDPHRGFVDAVNLANLQALVAPVLPREDEYRPIAYGVSLVLLGLWAVPAVRMPNSLPKHLLGLGCMAVFTLLPIYHRQYDTRILILLLPAVAWLVAWRPRSWGLAAVFIFAVSVVTTSHQFMHLLMGKRFGGPQSADGIKTSLLFRPLPVTELALMSFMLLAFWAVYRAGTREPDLRFIGEDAFLETLRGGGPKPDSADRSPIVRRMP